MVTWVSWASGSAWANPTLAREIRMKSMPALKFQQFVDVPDDFGPGQGSEYYYAIMKELDGQEDGTATSLAANTLAENSPIPLDQWDHLRASISVVEYGRGASWSKKHQILTKWNMDTRTRTNLKRHYTRMMDLGASTAFRSTDTIYVPTGVAAGTYYNTGTPLVAAAANLTLYHLKAVHDYLTGTLYAEPYDDDGRYIAILNTKAIRGLKNDADITFAQAYAEPRMLLNGEIGTVEGFRVIENNNSTNLPDVSANCGGGVFFGKDAVTHPVVAAPTILAESTGDFGRVLRLAWWGIFGWGITWDYSSHGQSKVIVLAST